MNVIIKIFLLSFILNLNVISFHANADEPKVYWAGVGFMGKWKDRDILYKHSSSMLCSAKSECINGNINKMAFSRLANKDYDNFLLEKTGTELGSVEGIVMALGILREELGITEDKVLGDKQFQHVYRLYGSIIFFEYGEGRVILSIPVVVQYTDYLDHIASDEEQLKIIKNLYSSDEGLNFFDELYKLAKKAKPDAISLKYTQITKVNLGESVLEVLDTKVEKVFGEQVAQILESQLVAKSNISLVPSAIGHNVVGSKITATFADASRELIIPEAQYKIEFDIRGFKKFESVKGKQKTVCFAVGTTLKIKDPFDDEMLNIRFARTKRACTVAAIEKEYDPLFYFPQSLFSLINNISSQFSPNGPSKEYLIEAAPKTKDAFEQIINVKKEIENF